jgi:predicted component of type VI protein secretion system
MLAAGTDTLLGRLLFGEAVAQAGLPRSIERILNAQPVVPEDDRLRGTILCYGLMFHLEFAHGADEWLPELAEAIRNAITWFEPRLRDVEVGGEPAPPGVVKLTVVARRADRPGEVELDLTWTSQARWQCAVRKESS